MMKVKINYTVDLEKVPGLIQEIVVSVKRDLADCASRLVFNPNDLDKMTSDFQIAREKLDLADNQIQDIVSMTEGWLRAIQPVPENEEPVRQEEAVHGG